MFQRNPPPPPKPGPQPIERNTRGTRGRATTRDEALRLERNQGRPADRPDGRAIPIVGQPELERHPGKVRIEVYDKLDRQRSDPNKKPEYLGYVDDNGYWCQWVEHHKDPETGQMVWAHYRVFRNVPGQLKKYMSAEERLDLRRAQIRGRKRKQR